LDDLIEEFSEGRVQFAYLKVIDPNTGLPKNVLIAWCGEGVPERTKGYFTSHLASVSKFLHVRNQAPAFVAHPFNLIAESQTNHMLSAQIGVPCANHSSRRW
jgi:hypothetical protein